MPPYFYLTTTAAVFTREYGSYFSNKKVKIKYNGNFLFIPLYLSVIIKILS